MLHPSRQRTVLCATTSAFCSGVSVLFLVLSALRARDDRVGVDVEEQQQPQPESGSTTLLSSFHSSGYSIDFCLLLPLMAWSAWLAALSVAKKRPVDSNGRGACCRRINIAAAVCLLVSLMVPALAFRVWVGRPGKRVLSQLVVAFIATQVVFLFALDSSSSKVPTPRSDGEARYMQGGEAHQTRAGQGSGPSARPVGNIILQEEQEGLGRTRAGQGGSRTGSKPTVSARVVIGAFLYGFALQASCAGLLLVLSSKLLEGVVLSYAAAVTGAGATGHPLTVDTSSNAPLDLRGQEGKGSYDSHPYPRRPHHRYRRREMASALKTDDGLHDDAVKHKANPSIVVQLGDGTAEGQSEAPKEPASPPRPVATAITTSGDVVHEPSSHAVDTSPSPWPSHTPEDAAFEEEEEGEGDDATDESRHRTGSEGGLLRDSSSVEVGEAMSARRYKKAAPAAPLRVGIQRGGFKGVAQVVSLVFSSSLCVGIFVVLGPLVEGYRSEQLRAARRRRDQAAMSPSYAAGGSGAGGAARRGRRVKPPVYLIRQADGLWRSLHAGEQLILTNEATPRSGPSTSLASPSAPSRSGAAVAGSSPSAQRRTHLQQHQLWPVREEDEGEGSSTPLVPGADSCTSQSSSNSSSSSGPETACYICCQEHADAVIAPCGHGGIGFDRCAPRVIDTTNACPTCRAPIKMILKIRALEEREEVAVIDSTTPSSPLARTTHNEAAAGTGITGGSWWFSRRSGVTAAAAQPAASRERKPKRSLGPGAWVSYRLLVSEPSNEPHVQPSRQVGSQAGGPMPRRRLPEATPRSQSWGAEEFQRRRIRTQEESLVRKRRITAGSRGSMAAATASSSVPPLLPSPLHSPPSTAGPTSSSLSYNRVSRHQRGAASNGNANSLFHGGTLVRVTTKRELERVAQKRKRAKQDHPVAGSGTSRPSASGSKVPASASSNACQTSIFGRLAGHFSGRQLPAAAHRPTVIPSPLAGSMIPSTPSGSSSLSDTLTTASMPSPSATTKNHALSLPHVEVALVVDYLRGKPTYEQEYRERQQERFYFDHEGRRVLRRGRDHAGQGWEADSDDEDDDYEEEEEEEEYESDGHNQEGEEGGASEAEGPASGSTAETADSNRSRQPRHQTAALVYLGT